MALRGIWRFTNIDYPDDLEWTFVFEGEGSLDVTADGRITWDPGGDIDWTEEEDYVERIWP